MISHFWYKKWGICLFLVLGAFAVFYRVSGYDFVNFDDDLYVTANSRIQSGLSLKNIVWAFRATEIGNWHPVTWISHMLDVQLWGLDSGRHHLVSLLFHMINTLLLFLTLNRMTGALWRSAFVAALFAVHPVNVESVAWVAERKNVLSTFFWMLTVWSYHQYVENPTRVKYLAMILLFMLGLITKPMLVTLPFVLLLLDYWPLQRIQFAPNSISNQARLKSAGRSDSKNRPHPLDGASASFLNLQSRSVWYLIREKIPLLVLSAVSCWVTYLVQQGSGAVRSIEAISLTSRVANALVAYVAYIGKMIFPLRLAVFYPYPAVISAWKIAGAGCILGFLFYLAWKLRTRHPYILVGWFWYIGTLFPVIGLVQIGAQAMADRYGYVPLIGLFIAIVWSVAGFIKKRSPGTKLIVLTAVLIVCFLGMLTWVQVGYWRNSIELYRHAVKVTRDNYLAHNNLGNALLIQGKNDEAYSAYAEALRIYPDYADAHYNIGRLLDTGGKLDAAIIHYEAAIKVNPRFKKAYYNLGNVLANKGSYAEAMGNYDQALQIDPDYAEAHNNLGVVLVRQGKINEALSHFLKAVELKDGYVEARDNLLKALSDMQRFE